MKLKNQGNLIEIKTMRKYFQYCSKVSEVFLPVPWKEIWWEGRNPNLEIGKDFWKYFNSSQDFDT